jgi:hypothetical protein
MSCQRQWKECVTCIPLKYRIAENFCGVQFSRMASLQSLIFADMCDRAVQSYLFAGLIFVDSRLSAKTAKISRYTVQIHVQNWAWLAVYMVCIHIRPFQ